MKNIGNNIYYISVFKKIWKDFNADGNIVFATDI